MTTRKTEQHSAVEGIDTWEDQRILETLFAGQERALASVSAVLPKISAAATLLAARLAAGGRLAYAGAGTSIRIAVQDGSELPATFGMPEDQLLYLIAGGREAMFDSMADAEDDEAAGTADGAQCNERDTLVAVAASGTTPYTIAAANSAKAKGCAIVAVTNNQSSPLGALADVEIVLDSGPEVIAGSTRMGAGTAQKAALNLLSTLTHIKLGAVYDGMMVNVQIGNTKLQDRAAGIIMRITGANHEKAQKALAATGAVKPAILLCSGAKDSTAARELLALSNGNLRQALARLARS